MATTSVAIRFIVNRAGQLPSTRDACVDPSWTVDRVIQEWFASELSESERVRLIFMGQVLRGDATLRTYISPPSLSTSGARPASREGPCTIHAHITRAHNLGSASASAGGYFGGGGAADDGDWSAMVLRLTSFLILSACWYHRAICPSDYTLVSTGILCVFSSIFAFSVRRSIQSCFRAIRMQDWTAAFRR
ncbi:transmembrane protein [Cystoisospora suis]|uniref:Transmembrane protein n=1 Tax=Cystoisospora suis TaxID=483139 RepID=A0A2C6L3F9_9APIC|nr:transmembrane protein [Cystoisospora suis]